PGKFARIILPGRQNIDCLIAFTATIIYWALENIKRRCEVDFESMKYTLFYNQALA
ncbi:hypothetical protein V8B97DRAFT_1877900, partial [Scleroderma yunnanense]